MYIYIYVSYLSRENLLCWVLFFIIGSILFGLEIIWKKKFRIILLIMWYMWDKMLIKKLKTWSQTMFMMQTKKFLQKNYKWRIITMEKHDFIIVISTLCLVIRIALTRIHIHVNPEFLFQSKILKKLTQIGNLFCAPSGRIRNGSNISFSHHIREVILLQCCIIGVDGKFRVFVLNSNSPPPI